MLVCKVNFNNNIVHKILFSIKIIQVLFYISGNVLIFFKYSLKILISKNCKLINSHVPIFGLFIKVAYICLSYILICLI